MNNSRSEIEAIARHARRKPGNEASLLWAAASIALILCILVFFPDAMLDTIGLRANVTASSIICGTVLGAIPAFAYFRISKAFVDKKILENNEIMKELRAKRQLEVDEKIANMVQNGSNL